LDDLIKPLGNVLAPGASDALLQNATAVFSESAIFPPLLGGKKKHRLLLLNATVFPGVPVPVGFVVVLRKD
jgi:hypothetical protein